MSKLPKKHPDAGRPEDRVGTRSHRAYALHHLQGNAVSGGMVAMLATARQSRKAEKLYYAGVLPDQVQGRVIRACLRAMIAWIGYCEQDYADSQYFGEA